MTQTQKLLPIPDLDTKDFWDGCRHHYILVQRCRNCGTFRYYPRPMCHNCNSMDTEWVRATGKGKIYSWTVTTHQFHPNFKPPYIIAIVELEEGIRMTSNIMDCDPEELWIGMPVEVIFDDITSKITLPKFKPVK